MTVDDVLRLIGEKANSLQTKYIITNSIKAQVGAKVLMELYDEILEKMEGGK